MITRMPGRLVTKSMKYLVCQPLQKLVEAFHRAPPRKSPSTAKRAGQPWLLELPDLASPANCNKTGRRCCSPLWKLDMSGHHDWTGRCCGRSGYHKLLEQVSSSFPSPRERSPGRPPRNIHEHPDQTEGVVVSSPPGPAFAGSPSTATSSWSPGLLSLIAFMRC